MNIHIVNGSFLRIGFCRLAALVALVYSAHLAYAGNPPKPDGGKAQAKTDLADVTSNDYVGQFLNEIMEKGGDHLDEATKKAFEKSGSMGVGKFMAGRLGQMFTAGLKILGNIPLSEWAQAAGHHAGGDNEAAAHSFNKGIVGMLASMGVEGGLAFVAGGASLPITLIAVTVGVGTKWMYESMIENPPPDLPDVKMTQEEKKMLGKLWFEGADDFDVFTYIKGQGEGESDGMESGGDFMGGEDGLQREYEQERDEFMAKYGERIKKMSRAEKEVFFKNIAEGRVPGIVPDRDAQRPDTRPGYRPTSRPSSGSSGGRPPCTCP